MDKHIVTYDELHNLTVDLYNKISVEFNPDYIVGLARGGLLPGVILSHLFDKPFIPLHWSTRDFPSSDHIKQLSSYIPDDIINESRRVLVVDDICDTGKTFNEVLTDWENNLPTWNKTSKDNLKFAAVYERYTSNFNLDYRTIKLDNDSWVVFPFEQK